MHGATYTDSTIIYLRVLTRTNSMELVLFFQNSKIILTSSEKSEITLDVDTDVL
jgi:hypothetical protein